MDLSHITQKQVAELEELFFQCALGLLRASKKFSPLHPPTCLYNTRRESDRLSSQENRGNAATPSLKPKGQVHSLGRQGLWARTVCACVCVSGKCV